MKKTTTILLALLLSGQSFAAFNGLTWHSRSNCMGINESISWDWTQNHVLRTISEHHYCPYSALGNCHFVHKNDTGFEDTWRNAVVHWTEAKRTNEGEWYVKGTHFIKEGSNVRKLGYEEIKNCDVYNGWWERNK